MIITNNYSAENKNSFGLIKPLEQIINNIYIICCPVTSIVSFPGRISIWTIVTYCFISTADFILMFPCIELFELVSRFSPRYSHPRLEGCHIFQGILTLLWILWPETPHYWMFTQPSNNYASARCSFWKI